MDVEELFQVLAEIVEYEETDQETEGLINYLILTVDAYLVRRRNIFAIIGKDENNP